MIFYDAVGGALSISVVSRGSERRCRDGLLGLGGPWTPEQADRPKQAILKLAATGHRMPAAIPR